MCFSPSRWLQKPSSEPAEAQAHDQEQYPETHSLPFSHIRTSLQSDFPESPPLNYCLSPARFALIPWKLRNLHPSVLFALRDQGC